MIQSATMKWQSAWEVCLNCRPCLRIGLESAFCDLALAFALIGCPSSAFAAEVQAPQLALVDALRSPSLLLELRDRLHGSLQISIGDVRLDEPTNFVVSVVTHVAKNCGITVSAANDANADHYLWLLPITDPTEDSIAAKFDYIGRSLHRDNSAENHRLAKEVLRQIATNGISIPIITIDDVSSTNDVTIVFWNAADLAGKNAEAIMDFGIFSGLVGFPIQPIMVGDNRFSYLYGGGNISQLAGDNSTRYTKMCQSLSLVEAICDRKLTESISENIIENNLAYTASRCQSGSSPIGLLRHFDDLLKRGMEK
jgi:hypothetical protein